MILELEMLDLFLISTTLLSSNLIITDSWFDLTQFFLSEFRYMKEKQNV